MLEQWQACRIKGARLSLALFLYFLVRNADRAMYCAKQLGRNNFQFYASQSPPAAGD
jgi:GGDEF domain-containing protein